jgi:hypothetical protein
VLSQIFEVEFQIIQANDKEKLLKKLENSKKKDTIITSLPESMAQKKILENFSQLF